MLVAVLTETTAVQSSPTEKSGARRRLFIATTPSALCQSGRVRHGDRQYVETSHHIATTIIATTIIATMIIIATTVIATTVIATTTVAAPATTLHSLVSSPSPAGHQEEACQNAGRRCRGWGSGRSHTRPNIREAGISLTSHCLRW